MAGGDEGSSDDVLADLPHDRHAGSLGVSDLERELFEQSLTGSGGGGAGGGHSEPPGGEGSGGTVRFTINDYLAQERSRRTFGTVAKPLHASAGPGSPGNRPAPNASSIVRREREKTILRHLNNMTDRGTYTTGHSRFDLDPQGHLKESVCHQHGDAHGGHAEILPWYAPPIQRQRWNEDHVLPHVDWGDLFYDLFYVGAAYNFGVMLTSAIATGNWAAGIIYYVGTFGPLWMAWEIQHAARFTCVDYFHWLYEVLRYIFVGTAVAHVSIIKNMDDGSSDALAFTIAILCESLMNLGRTVETYYKAEGDRECIKNQCSRDMKYKILPYIAVVLSALAVEISFHFDEIADEYSSGSRRLAGDYGGDDPYDTGTTDPYRWDYGDLPLTLLAIGYVFNQVLDAIGEWRAIVNDKLDIRSRFVPMNVEMTIHRYGEWLLLMIGEGILSLLIVETTPTLSHYIITTCGLVAFGVTYKILLKNEYTEAQYDKASRLLAASPKVEPETAATLFTGGLTAVLVALELLTLTHGGFEKAWGNLYKSSGNGSAYNWPVILMTVFKIGLFGFTATLNLWTSESHTLAYCGCAVVMAIAFSRVFIFKFIQKVLA
ncbi:hypothetical protein THAOC_31910 [Thalassiosira oceanica]|uniref:Uncharacterized protein n=1 Tax=Thalassiosira oceanica TaxID=159749 RepID=K0RK52_THAOC|nr:hypothetical protein THAOC_31910 [Thalassiosira oceanica]|eukprot:EJK49236.1 hypothetical protein THAOC_31910 [Thalassiosira oceanica]